MGLQVAWHPGLHAVLRRSQLFPCSDCRTQAADAQSHRAAARACTSLGWDQDRHHCKHNNSEQVTFKCSVDYYMQQGCATLKHTCVGAPQANRASLQRIAELCAHANCAQQALHFRCGLLCMCTTDSKKTSPCKMKPLNKRQGRICTVHRLHFLADSCIMANVCWLQLSGPYLYRTAS